MTMVHTRHPLPAQRTGASADPGGAHPATTLAAVAGADLDGVSAAMALVRDASRRRDRDPHAWRLAIEDLVARGSRLVGLRTHVLLPALAAYGDGVVDADVRASLAELEVALSAVFRRVHGDSHERRPVAALEQRADEALRLYVRVERDLLARCGALPARVQDGIAAGLLGHDRHAPTRPHPHLVRRGWLGRAGYAVVGRLDRVLDRLDSRPLSRR